MAMRSLLSRNLTGATRRFSDSKGPNYHWPNPEKEIERQHSEKLKKQKAEEKLKKEEEGADKEPEGTHHHLWNIFKRH